MAYKVNGDKMTFIRWRGGKVNLISQLNELFPDMYTMNGYIEPFIGGGSVFFFLIKNYKGALKEKPIYLSDINPELINCYRVVRDKVNELISLLEKHQKLNNEKYFYSIRDLYPPGNEFKDIERASMFIYLCNTCFGGEWRVNSEGKFNKAYGGQNNARVFDKDELLECSKLLKDIKLNVMSFENIVKIKNINNFFVYMDPPYFDIGNRNFTQYSQDGFNILKRTLIGPTFQKLDKLGCKVMMSNSFKTSSYASSSHISEVSPIEQMFKSYKIIRLQTKRMHGVALDKVTKNKIENAERLEESVIMNYEPIKKQKTIDEAWE